MHMKIPMEFVPAPAAKDPASENTPADLVRKYGELIEKIQNLSRTPQVGGEYTDTTQVDDALNELDALHDSIKKELREMGVQGELKL